MRFREIEEPETVALDPGLEGVLPKDFLSRLRGRNKTYFLNQDFFSKFKVLLDGPHNGGFEKTFVENAKTFHKQHIHEAKTAKLRKTGLSPKLIKFRAKLYKRYLRLIVVATMKANRKRVSVPSNLLKKLFGS
jgi:hypothetical protein